MDGGLVGLARVLSDMSIVTVQDVLVDPDHQRKGVGLELLKLCLDGVRLHAFVDIAGADLTSS